MGPFLENKNDLSIWNFLPWKINGYRMDIYSYPLLRESVVSAGIANLITVSCK